MKSVILIILSLFFFVGSAQSGEVVVKDYQKFKNLSRVQDYVWGAGDAFVWANDLLNSTKQKRLFCKPERLVLEKQNFLQILENAIDDPEFNVKPEMPVPVVLFMGLMKTFPCK